MASSSTADIQMVPYYGQSVGLVVSDALVRSTSATVKDFTEKIEGGNDQNWLSLKSKLITLVNQLDDERNLSCRRRYKLDLLNEAVVPYLLKMKSRISLEKSRFSQMEQLICLLSSTTDVHPSAILLEVDKILLEINKTGGWFKSEMASLLEASVARQWRPMIADVRNSLWNIGGTLSVAGFVEVVGRFFIKSTLFKIIIRKSN
jgi:hypothetical protein